MSSSAKPVRSSIFRITNEARQQRILRAIERVNDPAITAIGTGDDGEFHIVADCRTAVADMHVRRIVVSLDLNASRVSTTESPSARRPAVDQQGSLGSVATCAPDARTQSREVLTLQTKSYLIGLGLPRVVVDNLRKIPSRRWA